MITLQEMAEHRFSNVYYYQCLTLELYLYTAKLIIQWYANFGENQTILQRNGMTTIPEI